MRLKKKKRITLDYRGPAPRCMGCGYELHATTATVCPECGRPRGYYILIPPSAHRARARIGQIVVPPGMIKTLIRSARAGAIVGELACINADQLDEAAARLESYGVPFDADHARAQLLAPRPPRLREAQWLVDTDDACPACSQSVGPDDDPCPACGMGLIRLDAKDAYRLRYNRILVNVIVHFVIWGTVVGVAGMILLTLLL